MKSKGLAASVSLAPTLWGRPLGDVRRWYTEKILNLRLRFDRLRQLYDQSPASAIRAAVALGGPAALLQHSLKGTAPADLHLLPPLQLDDEWASLITGFCGVVPQNWSAS